MAKLKVLIADDNPRIASALEDIMKQDPEIEVAGKAEDGVEVWKMAHIKGYSI